MRPYWFSLEKRFCVGGAAIGALFGAKTSSEKAAEQSFQSRFDPLIAQQTAAGGAAMGRATPLLDKAVSTIDKPLDFWTTLLKGDRSASSAMLGPTLDAIGDRDAASKAAFSQFAPRGSSMGARLGELSQGTTSDVNRAFLDLQPQAADQLGQLAQLLFGVGTNLFNSSTGASGNALQALLGQRSGNQQSQAMRMQGNQHIFDELNGLGKFLGGRL